ncbi:hypothetical protein GDO81_002010 [Engystomops pustulosus]|nr:hypothetical protein GDO81_002010 [Engystomops pustulosus]
MQRLLRTGPTLGCLLLMFSMVLARIILSCSDLVLQLDSLEDVWDESPLLFHICGVISGLAVRAGLLHHFELSVLRRQALDSTHLCSCLGSFNLARFIPAQAESTLLHDINSTAQERLPFTYIDAYESVLSSDFPIGGTAMHNSNVTNLRESPVWLGDPISLEDEMLEAGILASLREYEEQEKRKQETTLNKSSVSALR